ncbi:SDR family NAD(P)-dependent oxidoreductase [Yinghuangia seranimata]|uniref:SDR family NAD(P)-dependent oxidoreductase n=1 Tax=Yinghuangia seranimata TaxID=408067 RepID=UPI00248D0AFE|nr:SDR family NAD(P)-dependent oxidoreductase [Yinghuangia seranimata]MDI2130000.1 SDR family oxidoreductase [Yinghuangia seranimata]
MADGRQDQTDGQPGEASGPGAPAPIRLDGQVALVTGAGRGLGREHALALAARGAQVVVNDLPDADGTDHAAALVAEIVKNGGTATADTHSVADEADAVVATAIDTYGRLDVLVNNAGISHGGMFDQIPVEVFDRMLDVHLHGTVAVTRAAWPHLRATGGRVVNTTSNSVFGITGTSHYITAKGGVLGLTKSLAMDGRVDGIRVNAIMPVAYTRMTAGIPDEVFRAFLEEHFTSDKVAPFVVWLAAPDVPVTGEIFSVGGGRAARVVLGVNGGVLSDTPEGYGAQVDRLLDLEGTVFPADATREVLHAAAGLGLFEDGNPLAGAWKQ